MMKRNLSIILAAALLALILTACPASNSSQAHSARRAELTIAQGVSSAIQVKRDLKAAHKIDASEALAVDDALLKFGSALDQFHVLLANAPSDTSQATIAQWLNPVLDALSNLQNLAFKNSDSQAAFQTAVQSIKAGVQIYLSLKGAK